MIILDILRPYIVKFWPWFYQWRHKVMRTEFVTEKITECWWLVKKQGMLTQLFLLCLGIVATLAAIFKVYAKFTKVGCKSSAKLDGKTALITGANSGTWIRIEPGLFISQLKVYVNNKWISFIRHRLWNSQRFGSKRSKSRFGRKKYAKRGTSSQKNRWSNWKHKFGGQKAWLGFIARCPDICQANQRIRAKVNLRLKLTGFCEYFVFLPDWTYLSWTPEWQWPRNTWLKTTLSSTWPQIISAIFCWPTCFSRFCAKLRCCRIGNAPIPSGLLWFLP